MALITDTMESLRTEKMFTITGENWRKVPATGNTPTLWVAISGTITHDLPEYANAFATQLNETGSELLIMSDYNLNDRAVHRIVATAFWNECFLNNYYTDADKADLEMFLFNRNEWDKIHHNDSKLMRWEVHHKDNNANNNSVPNLVWLRKSDHNQIQSCQTFAIAGL